MYINVLSPPFRSDILLLVFSKLLSNIVDSLRDSNLGMRSLNRGIWNNGLWHDVDFLDPALAHINRHDEFQAFLVTEEDTYHWSVECKVNLYRAWVVFTLFTVCKMQKVYIETLS